MKKLKKEMVIYKIGSLVSLFAFMVTALNVNSTCVYIAHQSKLPDTSKKLRKF